MAEHAIADANWELVPDHLHHQLERWLCYGKAPKSRFLLAVLVNDLSAAVLAAHILEERRLCDLARFLIDYAPKAAFGSPDLVINWEFIGGLHGRPLAEMLPPEDHDAFIAKVYGS